MSTSGALIATPSQTVGPFFSFGLTTNHRLGRLVPAGVSVDCITLKIRIVSGDGEPVPDSMIELWHRGPDDTFLFGRLGTDETGSAAFDTVWPRTGSSESGDAAHWNLCIFMRGLLRHVYTRVYRPGPALSADPVLLLVPEHRRGTLVAKPSGDSPDTWLFDVRLQGDQETVFFNV